MTSIHAGNVGKTVEIFLLFQEHSAPSDVKNISVTSKFCVL
jgi:hypothetical protein